MLCPHCGVKLKDSNQKFCQNCGSEISTAAEDSQIIKRPSIPKIIEVPVSEKQILAPGTPGRYSKECLFHAIVSISIVIPFIILGFIIFWPPVRLFGLTNYELARRFYVLIVLIIIHVVGLFFAGKSRKYGKLAKESEPANTAEKVGSSLRIVGEIINAILIGVYFTILMLVVLLLVYV
ncbi:MAG: zinc-ribbon domain-containing protein [Promethearchaeota archaeon]